jgi:hypothetical protein
MGPIGKLALTKSCIEVSPVKGNIISVEGVPPPLEYVLVIVYLIKELSLLKRNETASQQ